MLVVFMSLWLVDVFEQELAPCHRAGSPKERQWTVIYLATADSKGQRRCS
jgi:hypothetical protein